MKNNIFALAMLLPAFLTFSCSKSEKGSGSSGQYYYSNWTCTSPGCTTRLGNTIGSSGPFCNVDSCRKWSSLNVAIFNNYSTACIVSVTNTIYFAPPASEPCMLVQ